MTIRTRRLQQFNTYMAAFSEAEEQGLIGLPKNSSDTVGNGHMFYLLLPDRARRDALIAGMRAAGVNAVFHYVPLHSSPAGKNYARTPQNLPVTDDISARLVRLPLFHGLGDDIHKVIDTIGQILDTSGIAPVVPSRPTGPRGNGR